MQLCNIPPASLKSAAQRQATRVKADQSSFDRWDIDCLFAALITQGHNTQLESLAILNPRLWVDEVLPNLCSFLDQQESLEYLVLQCSGIPMSVVQDCVEKNQRTLRWLVFDFERLEPQSIYLWSFRSPMDLITLHDSCALI